MKKDAAGVGNLSMYDIPQGQDYFVLLELEKNFSLSLDTLEKQYIKLQKQSHPDMAGKTSVEQEKAFLQTTLLNQAYETLKSPVKRGEYLLTLQGESKPTSLPFELLETILEKQEHFFSLEKEEDIEAALSILRKEKEDLECKTEEAFEEKKYDEIRMLLLELQYYERIQHHLEEKLV